MVVAPPPPEQQAGAGPDRKQWGAELDPKRGEGGGKSGVGSKAAGGGGVGLDLKWHRVGGAGSDRSNGGEGKNRARFEAWGERGQTQSGVG